MRKLYVALVLGLALSSVLILSLILPPANADEPKYNLGVVYGEAFPKIKPGGTGEVTIYFYSAFGNVTCYVTPGVNNSPSGWSVDFAPENTVVVPQWFENQPFSVADNEACLSLYYKDNNGADVKGWVRAYPMKVIVTAPQGTSPGKYPVKISYVGDFRMGGMSAIKRSGGVDWTVEVEGTPIFSSGSGLLIVLVICVVAIVGSIIAVKTIKSRRSGRATQHQQTSR
jgi:hypothetical protein